MKNITTQVCIVGAGPGGAVLGLILAKAGINVVLIERAEDHQREFRGEFIAPDSIEILKQLKIFDEIEANSYLNNQGMELYDNGKLILKLDFLNSGKSQPIDIPQPTLLKTLIQQAEKYNNFSYLNKTTAKNLIIEGEKVIGINCNSHQKELSIHAQLIVGADGRYGKIRSFANFSAEIKPLNRDFVWFNLPRPADWKEIIKLKLYKNYQLMILPAYPDLLRVGFNIPSGEYRKLTKKDIHELHDLVTLLEPRLKTIVENSINNWSQTSLLDIFTATLKTWSRDGLVVIGDAAHTLTPVLGQGVNHAITDAAVLANHLIKFFNENPDSTVTKKVLDQFEAVRRPDVEFVKRFQMRQEKMLQLKGSIALGLRKIFYLMLGNSVLKRILMKKIFYKNKVLL